MIDWIKAEIERCYKEDDFRGIDAFGKCLKKAEECRDKFEKIIGLPLLRQDIEEAFEGSNKLLKSTNECQISSSNHSSKENK